jgi:hypothetical protein
MIKRICVRGGFDPVNPRVKNGSSRRTEWECGVDGSSDNGAVENPKPRKRASVVVDLFFSSSRLEKIEKKKPEKRRGVNVWGGVEARQAT